MSPVEPSPVMIGTMGTPSIDGMVTCLRFFAKSPPPLKPEDVKTLLAAPIAARKERRLQPNFILGLPSLQPTTYLSAVAAGGFITLALPTISISESPGIHSTAMQARDGALPGEKYVP